MPSEIMDLQQLAAYLQRDARELSRLASRGHLPGQKIAGEWRFASAEINYWVETQIHGYSEAELAKLECGAGQGNLGGQPLIAGMLTEATTAVPLPARTKTSVLQELVRLAERSWHVYDPDALLEAIRAREEMSSTALESGVAIPHPRRPNPNILGDSVLAYGRVAGGIPFGGQKGALTDIFFLVCCRTHTTHLSVLARLARILLRPGLVEELRAADTAADTVSLLEAAEREVLAMA